MTSRSRHYHPDFEICIAQKCNTHKHRRHPGQGHCEGCLNDQNDGYADLSDFCFLSRCTDKDHRCCCKDNRVHQR